MHHTCYGLDSTKKKERHLYIMLFINSKYIQLKNVITLTFKILKPI